MFLVKGLLIFAVHFKRNKAYFSVDLNIYSAAILLLLLLLLQFTYCDGS